MENRVRKFVKTEHFMYRQWDRGVDDEVLKKALKNVEPGNGRLLIVFSRTYLQQMGFKVKSEIFVKVCGNVLITCYYEDFNNYYKLKNKQKCQII